MADSILRLPAVKTRTGLSRSTIYLRVSQGTFPRPVSLGGRAVGWVDDEIQSWLAERIAASRNLLLGRGEHLHWRDAEFRQQILDWADEPKDASTEQGIPTITVVVHKVDRLTRSLDGLVYTSNERFSDNEPSLWKNAAASVRPSGPAATSRRSVKGSLRIKRSCALYPRRRSSPATSARPKSPRQRSCAIA
jgi:prophage regulatory protein